MSVRSGNGSSAGEYRSLPFQILECIDLGCYRAPFFMEFLICRAMHFYWKQSAGMQTSDLDLEVLTFKFWPPPFNLSSILVDSRGSRTLLRTWGSFFDSCCVWSLAIWLTSLSSVLSFLGFEYAWNVAIIFSVFLSLFVSLCLVVYVFLPVFRYPCFFVIIAMAIVPLAIFEQDEWSELG